VAEDLPEFPETGDSRQDAVLTDDVWRIVAARPRSATTPRAARGMPPGNLYEDISVVGSAAVLQGIGQPNKAAHLRARVGPVATPLGERILKIWVADDCWTGGSKPYLMAQEMVDAVADRFLKEGLDNDLYEAITAITGPEYGSGPQNGNPDLVSFNGEIHLFLYDLDDDAVQDQNNGWAGFFNAGDLYSYDGSNQNVFLHIDAPFMATPTEGVWDIGKGWPARFVGVIAHEFTHAAQYYAQDIMGSVSQPLWVTEMIPQMVEDAVSSRTGDPFPFGEPRSDGASSAGRRGTRLASLNAYPNQSFEGRGSSWRSIRTWYAANALFGSYLLRRFGGPVVVTRILEASKGGWEGITEALASLGFTETPDSLLQGWAKDVLVSDIEGTILNHGGWFSFAVDGTGYELFSLNFVHHEAWDSRPEVARFVAGPQARDMADLSPDSPFNPTANTYYLVGKNVTGTYTLRISHPDLPLVKLLLVVKPSP
jgi:hypothetical protein